MFYFWTYSNVWDKTLIGYSITISWSVKTPDRKKLLCAKCQQEPGRTFEFQLEIRLTQGTRSAEDMQSLAEMDEWNPSPAGISLCLNAQRTEAWIPLWLCRALSTPPQIKEVLSFLSKWSFWRSFIRSEYHPTDTTILQRCFFLQQFTKRWWGCKWLQNEHSLQFYSRAKIVGRCSISSFGFEERF